MSEVISTTGRTAENIAAEIRTLDTQGKYIGLMYVFEIGKRLEEAKSLVGHGHWGEYLKAQVGYSQDTANKYMKVYREYQNNGVFPNSDTFMNLDFSKAYKLLAVPAEERESFLQEHPVEDMTVRQLEQAIREREAELEKANTQTARAEEQLEELTADLREQADIIDRKDEELVKLEEEVASLRRAAEEAAATERKAGADVEELKGQLAKAKAAEKAAKAALKEAKANPVLPEEQVQKLKAEGAAEAAAKATEELQKLLSDAQAQVLKAEQERQQAEEAAMAAQKAAKLSGADAAVFKLLFTQVQEDFNKLMGALMKVRQSDAELGNKLTAAVQAVLDKTQRDLLGG